MFTCEAQNDLTILRMCESTNLITPSFIAALDAQLAEIDRAKNATVLVLTGSGRFFSAGFDTEVVQSLSLGDLQMFLDRFERLIVRLLELSVPTLAAIDGHAFGGGALLALACDYRVMREDRAYIRLSEIDAGFTFNPVITTMIRMKLPASTARDAVLTGRRYSAAAAMEAGFIDAQSAIDKLLSLGEQLCSSATGKERRSYQGMKRSLYRDVRAALESQRRTS